MRQQSVSETAKEHGRTAWPWWEPYVFTLGVLTACVVFFIACGFLAQIPFIVHALLILANIVTLIRSVNGSTTPPSLGSSCCLALFCGFVCYSLFSRSTWILGFGYAALTLLWLGMAVRAGIAYRQFRRERSAKLDRAVEALQHATKDRSWDDDNS